MCAWLPRLLAILTVLATAPTWAAECVLPAGAAGKVARVIDARTLQLGDGSEVRLLGIQPPAAPRWWKADERGPWPPGERALEALRGLAEGKSVRLHTDAVPRDRRGRHLAQVFLARDGAKTWLQGELVKRGQARAYAFADNRACAAALLALEAEARRANKGLWRSDAYAVLEAGEPAKISKRLQTFQIVEGRVQAVGGAQRWKFLNFGDDWKRDFTAAIARSDVKRFTQAGIELDALKGARLRVRGWVERWNGPAIKLSAPEQLEILERPKAAAASTGGQAAGQ